MNRYQTANEAKATFDDVYHAPTPHAYLNEMDRLSYEIGEQANPYFEAAARLLQEQQGPDDPLRLLDLGCSYGVGAALLNHSVSFSDLARFFAEQKTRDYEDCVEATRSWLAATESSEHFACSGMDCSREATTFAADAGLIEGAITRNLEENQTLSSNEIKLIRQCSLLTSTGVIGYVGDKTLSGLLTHLGRASARSRGPYSVVTILRMFDPAPIAATFKRFGYHFAALPGIRLRQRQFENAEEQARTLQLLKRRGLDTEGWESEGFLYADLFAGAPQKDFPILARCLQDARRHSASETLAGEVDSMPHA